MLFKSININLFIKYIKHIYYLNIVFILIKQFAQSECNTHTSKTNLKKNRLSHSIPRSLAHKLVNSLVLRPESDRYLGIINHCGIVPIAVNSKRAF